MEQSADRSERHEEILRQAAAQGVVKVRDLADRLKVHEMTIRRDLDSLTEEGLLERLYGGARIAQPASEEVEYHLRAARDATEKTRIARAALELVQDGDTIALDPSTTCVALANVLKARDVVVVTTSLEIANILARDNVNHLLVGGTYHPPSRAYWGPLTMMVLKRLHPDKVFFSSKRFSPRSGFTDVFFPEVEIKEQLIGASGSAIALLDHTKFGGEAIGTIVDASRVDVLVTDAPPDEAITAALESAGTRLVVASDA